MKFLNLLKKELKELLSMQTIIGMVVMLVVFYGLGTLMNGVMDDAMSSSDITICDMDNTDFTKSILAGIEGSGAKINRVEVSTDDRSALMKELDVASLVIIPQGFTKTVLTEKKQGELEIVSVMKNASLAGTIDSEKSSAVAEIITEATADMLMAQNYNFTADELTVIKEPVTLKEITVVDDKSTEISSTLISSFTMMQSMLIPIVIFILVMFSSQMIITAISTEKIDKTLETLLSAPVSRLSVLFSKMIAAALVALLSAGVYMLGFSKYMGGITGGISAEANSTGGVAAALKALGLQLMPLDYVFVGLQVFMTIMIALAVSLILGAMVTDAKSAQTLLMPIMFCAMIPYMLQMFTSINSLPMVARLIIYAIPFTHTFTAMDNLMFGNTALFWGGLAYQLVLFAVVMFFAVRLFTSDKIFTISLNLGQKMKAKKNKALVSNE